MTERSKFSAVTSRLWEFLIASHYFLAFATIIGTGIGFAVGKSDNSGLVAIIVLSIALFLTLALILYFQTQNKAEQRSIEGEAAMEKASYEGKIEALSRQHVETLRKHEGDMQSAFEKISTLTAEAKYRDMFKYLNEAFAGIRRAERDEAICNDQQLFASAFKDFCNTLHSAFHYVTGKEYHVCLKLITVPKSRRKLNRDKMSLSILKSCEVRTFIREGFQVAQRAAKDQMDIRHVISENSDFETVVDNWNVNQVPFCSNNLPKSGLYSNTRLLEWFTTNKYENVDGSASENWKLFYKSTIISAIGTVGKDSKGKTSAMIIGFLCIDSKDINTFDEEIDPLIISGCADGLFNPLYKYLTKFP